MFSLPWRRIGAAFAGGLLALAAVLAVLDVRVRGDDRVVRSCGSAFDVMAGRADWQVWRAEDVVEGAPAASGTVLLTRAKACPTAVNGRTAWAGGLAVAACVVAGLSWPRRSKPQRAAEPHAPTRRLAVSILATGSVLTVAGLAGIGLLAANPGSTLFLYVSRPVVVLIGLLLLAPVVALMFAGWALVLVVRAKPGDRAGGDDS